MTGRAEIELERRDRTSIMRGGSTSMSGFNTRVEYRGGAYIVQTQDKGPSSQYVESLIYKSGQLLASKRTFYTAFLDAADLADRVEAMMEDQHKRILEEIVEGRFD
jgi:hypothetical protein